jgi:hypothetical protein
MRTLEKVAGWGKREWVLTLRFRQRSRGRRSGEIYAIPFVFWETIPASPSSRFFRRLWDLARIRPPLPESMLYSSAAFQFASRSPGRGFPAPPRQQSPLLLSHVPGDKALLRWQWPVQTHENSGNKELALVDITLVKRKGGRPFDWPTIEVSRGH